MYRVGGNTPSLRNRCNQAICMVVSILAFLEDIINYNLPSKSIYIIECLNTRFKLNCDHKRIFMEQQILMVSCTCISSKNLRYLRCNKRLYSKYLTELTR